MTLQGHLTSLEAGGLIFLAQLQPEVEYLFRHALVQDAAYHSLVKIDRRRLHLAAGQALESLYPDRLASPELTPVLARHFAEAGDKARALRYYTLAGRAAAEVYANAEAIQLFGRALEVAQAMPEAAEAVVDLYLRRGRALELNAQDAEALANYEALEAWAISAGDRRGQLAALAARASVYVKPSVEQDLDRGYELSQQALALAREIGDRPGEAKALWNLLQYYHMMSQVDEALAYGKQALEIARAHGLREQTAYILTDLLKVRFQTDQPAEARADLTEAQSIWRELGKLNMLADNLATATLMLIAAGDYEQALAQSAEAQQISRAIGNLWNQSYALYMVDLVHFDRGDVGQAIEVAQACQRLAEQAGFADGLNQARFDLALIYGYLGALPQAFEAARSIQALVGGTSSWPLVGALIAWLHLRAGRLAEAQAALEAARITEDEAELRQWFQTSYAFVVQVRAELALAFGQHQRVLSVAEAFISYLRQNEFRVFLTDALYFKARALRAAGQVEAAQAALAEARAEAEDLGSRRVLWQILAELAAIQEGLGEPAAAQALWRRAAEIVEYIAAHTGAADLSDTFLRLPDVAEILRRAGQTAPPAGGAAPI